MQSKTVLYTVLIVQMLTLVAIIFNVFAARQFLGFVYLSFMPGFLIIKILKLEKVGLVETILFSIGLSLAFLMFFGLLLNTLYPALGLSNPLSAFSIIASISTIVLVLSLILDGRREVLSNFSLPRLKFSTIVLLLISIPLATVFGTESANVSGSTLVLMVLVIIVCLVVLGTILKGLIPSEIYPLAILAISFFLLFHVSLGSNFLIGADIHKEYYYAQLTSINSIWNRTIFYPYNAMLSVTILPVIFSKFLNLDLNWVFKVVYPLIYLFVPLALYQAYKKQTGSLIAFLSVFFFVLFNTFYGEMLGLAREMIGELFFALLILLIVESKTSLTKRRLLFLVFSASLVVSHYSLAYLFVFYLLFSFFLSSFSKRPDGKSPKAVTGSMILGYLVIVFSWNLLVTPASFEPLISFVRFVYNRILSHVPGPGVAGIMPPYISPLHEVSQYLFYLLQLFVVVGVVGLVVKHRVSRFNREYASMSIASMVVMLMCVFLPSFAAGLIVTRFYHLSLFFLAPFYITGGIILLNSLSKIRSRFSSIKNSPHTAPHLGIKKSWLFLVTVLLVILFLFQVGFIYEITGDSPTSISLSRDRMNSWTISMNQLFVDQQEVSAIKWLAEYKKNESMVYADAEGILYLASYGLISPERLNLLDPAMPIETIDSSYFFFDRLNVVNNIIVGNTKVWNNTDFSSVLNMADQIYSNGASDISYKYFP